MKKILIDDDYAQKIADVCHVPYIAVVRLRDEGCLNEKSVRDYLIKNDYWTLMRTNRFTRNQAMARIASQYGVSENVIQRALSTRSSNACHCRECGVKMLRSRWIANEYLCDKCLSKQIKT